MTMTEQELDSVYTALANAIESVGKDKASLMLATLALSLAASAPNSLDVLEKIKQAQRLSAL
jgi:replication-associated recombination protein RarA